MTYRVERDGRPRESFGEYRYRIYRNSQLVAYFWHDYRGNESGVEFIAGGKESDPVSYPDRFLDGGGPAPLSLSQRAIAYLDSKLAVSQ